MSIRGDPGCIVLIFHISHILLVLIDMIEHPCQKHIGSRFRWNVRRYVDRSTSLSLVVAFLVFVDTVIVSHLMSSASIAPAATSFSTPNDAKLLS